MSLPGSAAPPNIYATGIVLGGVGVLLRGPSGVGKSLLALELLDRQAVRGLPGFLVADDRIDLEAGGRGLTMRAPLPIAGLIELRGRGIVSRPYLQSAPLHLVVDLIDDFIRMVDEAELQTDLLGVTLPRCPVPRRGVVDSAHQLLLVSEALLLLGDGKQPVAQKTT